MACPICGGNCKDYTPKAGGVTVHRLREENADMKSVTLSKERVYVTADKTRAVKEGDPDAATLLVGKGGAIAPEVAEFYGIETYSGVAISRMPNDHAAERERMVTPGTGKETADNYEEMALRRSVRESVKGLVTTEGNRSAGRQGAMMAEAIIAKVKADVAAEETPAPVQAPEPGSRTKEIAPPPVGSFEPPDLSPSGNKPPNGQDPAEALESLQELEDAKEKTL